MKRILLLVLVLGFAVLGNAQTTTQGLGMKWNVMTREGDVTHFKGLEITVGDVRVTADEADANDSYGTIELRGNVVMVIRRTGR